MNKSKNDFSEQSLIMYREPKGKKVKAFFSKPELWKKKEKREGFLFHPFNINESNALFFPIDSKAKAIDSTFLLESSELKSTTWVEYKIYFEKIKEELINKKIHKMVAAQKQCVKRPKDFSPLIYFEKICQQFPDTFLSFIYIPKKSIWIGASPEILVKESAQKLITYSLAGTKWGNAFWTDKEKEEQSFVTDFIEGNLKKIFPPKAISLSKTKNIQIGQLNHLLTTIQVKKAEGESYWQQVIARLHPTPAVCGVPQKMSQKLIEQWEGFQRKYYAGFLGMINQTDTQLYVNIRCAEIFQNQIVFYAGGGITSQSIIRNEWKETQQKINNLKNLLP